MKKLIKLLLALAVGISVVVGTSGCVTSEGVEDKNRPYPAEHFTFYQELPNGNKVLCIWAKSGYGGGLSCDFAGDSIVKE